MKKTARYVLVLLGVVMLTLHAGYAKALEQNEIEKLISTNTETKETSIIEPTKNEEDSKISNIYLNEISWAGSSLSSSDEWIEIYNDNDIDIEASRIKVLGAGGNSGFVLSGIIPAKGFYVLSNFPAEDIKSILKNTDYVSSKISIPNTSFKISIMNNQTNEVIDEIDNESAIFAGSNSEPKRTMERINITDTNIASNWYSSDSRKNIDSSLTNPNVNCNLDYGTPGSANTTVKNESVITTIEFESECVTSGSIDETNSAVIVSGPLTQSIFEKEIIVQTDRKKIKLENYFENPNNHILVKFDSGQILTFNQNSLKKEFVKPEGVQSFQIILEVDLDEIETLKLDKLVIYDVSSSSNLSHIELMPDYLRESRIAPSQELSTEILIEPINLSQKTYYQLNLSSPVKDKANIKISLIDLNSEFTQQKTFISTDFVENTLTYSFYFEPDGNYILSIQNNSSNEVVMQRVFFTLINELPKIKINLIDLVSVDRFEYDTSTETLTIPVDNNTEGIILNSAQTQLCSNTTSCTISFDIIFDEIAHSKLLDILIGINSSEEKLNTYIQNINPDKINELKTYSYRQTLTKDSSSHAHLLVYSYNQTAFKITNFQIEGNNYSSTENLEIEPQYFNINSSQLYGLNGEILSLNHSSHKLEKGKYSLDISIKKNENFSENNYIFETLVYDDTGRKIGGKKIKENELSFFQTNEIVIEFELKKNSQIKIVFKAFGSHNESYSDFEITSINLKAVE